MDELVYPPAYSVCALRSSTSKLCNSPATNLFSSWGSLKRCSHFGSTAVAKPETNAAVYSAFWLR